MDGGGGGGGWRRHGKRTVRRRGRRGTGGACGPGRRRRRRRRSRARPAQRPARRRSAPPAAWASVVAPGRRLDPARKGCPTGDGRGDDFAARVQPHASGARGAAGRASAASGTPARAQASPQARRRRSRGRTGAVSGTAARGRPARAGGAARAGPPRRLGAATADCRAGAPGRSARTGRLDGRARRARRTGRRVAGRARQAVHRGRACAERAERGGSSGDRGRLVGRTDWLRARVAGGGASADARRRASLRRQARRRRSFARSRAIRRPDGLVAGARCGGGASADARRATASVRGRARRGARSRDRRRFARVLGVESQGSGVAVLACCGWLSDVAAGRRAGDSGTAATASAPSGRHGSAASGRRRRSGAASEPLGVAAGSSLTVGAGPKSHERTARCRGLRQSRRGVRTVARGRALPTGRLLAGRLAIHRWPRRPGGRVVAACVRRPAAASSSARPHRPAACEAPRGPSRPRYARRIAARGRRRVSAARRARPARAMGRAASVASRASTAPRSSLRLCSCGAHGGTLAGCRRSALSEALDVRRRSLWGAGRASAGGRARALVTAGRAGDGRRLTGRRRSRATRCGCGVGGPGSLAVVARVGGSARASTVLARSSPAELRRGPRLRRLGAGSSRSRHCWMRGRGRCLTRRRPARRDSLRWGVGRTWALAGLRLVGGWARCSPAARHGSTRAHGGCVAAPDVVVGDGSPRRGRRIVRSRRAGGRLDLDRCAGVLVVGRARDRALGAVCGRRRRRRDRLTVLLARRPAEPRVRRAVGRLGVGRWRVDCRRRGGQVRHRRGARRGVLAGVVELRALDSLRRGVGRLDGRSRCVGAGARLACRSRLSAAGSGRRLAGASMCAATTRCAGASDGSTVGRGLVGAGRRLGSWSSARRRRREASRWSSMCALRLAVPGRRHGSMAVEARRRWEAAARGPSASARAAGGVSLVVDVRATTRCAGASDGSTAVVGSRRSAVARGARLVSVGFGAGSGRRLAGRRGRAARLAAPGRRAARRPVEPRRRWDSAGSWPCHGSTRGRWWGEGRAGEAALVPQRELCRRAGRGRALVWGRRLSLVGGGAPLALGRRSGDGWAVAVLDRSRLRG